MLFKQLLDVVGIANDQVNLQIEGKGKVVDNGRIEGIGCKEMNASLGSVQGNDPVLVGDVRLNGEKDVRFDLRNLSNLELVTEKLGHQA